MLILSWNVAGLSTTVNRIHDHYKPQQQSSDKKVKLHPAAAVQEYFGRHGATILCLQEHKIPKTQLSGRHEPRQASNVAGYDSFWSCCVDESKKGLNGVVTYCAAGTVVSADASPLGSLDLDQQGRCVMTDHGSFVLFNVYVPASGGQPLSYKLKFLNALRRAMQHQRSEKKKPVILVGDLNISHTEKDVYWSDRVVCVHDILDEVATAEQSDLPRWKTELAANWSKIEKAMRTSEVVETQTTNPSTRDKFNKFRLAVTVDGRRVLLGSHETSPEYCKYSYDFEAWHYHDEETDQQVLGQPENLVRVEVLSELMLKIASVQWDDATQRLISQTAGTVNKISPIKQWLTAILEQDDMVDTFRHYYPDAEARFTCWHQFTNQRYSNKGARIDYTIIDRSLLPHLQKGDVESLRCCGNVDEPLGEAAALQAATAGGQFQPASYGGGGINEASQQALDTQFGKPHTGMVYTPPSFSDHIGVSLLLNDDLLQRDLVLSESNSATRKSQPHKLQKSIASFFPKSSAGTAKPKPKVLTNGGSNSTLKRSDLTKTKTGQSVPSTGKRRKPAPAAAAAGKKSANSILSHFGKKGK